MAPDQPLGPREQVTEARGSGPSERVSVLGRASAVPQRWCLPRCRHVPPAQNVEAIRMARQKSEKRRSIVAVLSF